MKPFYILVLAFASFSFQAQAQDKAKSKEVIVKTEVYCSHCNYCESCKPRIETALFELTGVKHAKLDIDAQTIKVVYNPKKTTPEEINKTILNSGYPANGVQPTAEAHGKLDACCQRKP
ncbi:hypothetical protein BH09BAC1_BH09BAC1_08840 [soil metagenome]